MVIIRKMIIHAMSVRGLVSWTNKWNAKRFYNWVKILSLKKSKNQNKQISEPFKMSLRYKI